MRKLLCHEIQLSQSPSDVVLEPRAPKRGFFIDWHNPSKPPATGSECNGEEIIERVSSAPAIAFPAGRAAFTDREKKVLELLVAGRSNKEIGSPLGIGERTVKAHVAKLMRKVGVQNRIELSVHAITHSLVTAK